MDYYVLQVAGLERASELIHGVGSAELVRVWQAPSSPYDYLAVRGDELDDALALGRSSGLDVLSVGLIGYESRDESTDRPAFEAGLPTYLMSGAVELFDSGILASVDPSLDSGILMSVGPSLVYCDSCETFHRKGQHTR